MIKMIVAGLEPDTSRMKSGLQQAALVPYDSLLHFTLPKTIVYQNGNKKVSLEELI